MFREIFPQRTSSQTTMGYFFPIQSTAWATHLQQDCDYYVDILIEEEVDTDQDRAA